MKDLNQPNKKPLLNLTILIFTFCKLNAASINFDYFKGNNDSITAREILAKIDYKVNCNDKLNGNNLTLKYKKSFYKKTAKKILKKTYGYSIIREFPINQYVIDKYLILWGKKRKKGYGGTFYMIINMNNNAVEYLSHGK